MKNKLIKPKDTRIKNSLFSFRKFVFYFIFIGFVVTCSFLLFFSQADYPDVDLIIMRTSISFRALITLGNILFLCIVFTIIDSIRKSVTFKRPLRRILEATHKVTRGDFKVRVKPLHTKAFHNEFDIIIEDFNRMIEELATTETLKTDFISNVSHEIKTPLSAIHNYATLLQDPDLSEEERIRYANNLQGVAKRMEGLISNILKLNKLENQQIFPSYIRYNLSEQLCSCMLIFEDEWESKNLHIETELQDDVTIECDRELLEIVWNNILSNALKFSNDNGYVSLKLVTQSDKAVVTISDTGCGMSEETMKRIFEKFYQGDTSHSTQGNGLGLALVKRIADIVSAEISVESTPETGTSFTVKIPLKPNK